METRFHITQFLRRQLEALQPRLAFAACDSADWRQWRAELRSKLADLLGPWPDVGPASAEVLGVTEEADHWREEIVLSGPGGPDMSCFLLRPKGVCCPRPGILALHGHGDFGLGKLEVAGLTESITGQGYGRAMVRAGYIVFTFDFFPFGARKETEHNAREGYEYACNSTLIRTLLWGHNLLTLNLSDVFRALDYVTSRAEVDPSRIGVMGCSYGGTASMYAAILDDRIKGAVLSCSLGEYRGHGIELDELCGVQVVPGILQWAEMGDVAGVLAPIPLWVESARDDPFFPYPYTEPTLARLRQVYDVAGATDQLSIRVYEGGHRYYGDGVIDFWNRHLGR